MKKPTGTKPKNGHPTTVGIIPELEFSGYRTIQEHAEAYDAKKVRERRILLRGARRGNEAMVAELERQGLRLWIRPGREGTILDRRN